MFNPQDLHVIILAGGNDLRLAPLSCVLSGAPIPKQFAFIAGNGSLLQQTVGPYAVLVPPERIVVVVSSAYADLARAQLHEYHGIDILVRPLDRGQDLDLLLALSRVVARAPKATVIVAPAHHYVPCAGVLVSSLVAAGSSLAAAPVILAGAAFDEPGGNNSFVVPGARLDGDILSVRSLAEHPSPREAERMKADGALWNTSALTARANDLWRAFAHQMPVGAGIMAGLWAKERPGQGAVAAAFHRLPEARPSGALWAGMKGLGVVPVRGSGWTDWTSPEQVMDSLGNSEELERLLSRIFRRQQALGRAEMRRPCRPEKTIHHARAA